jgi:hypothetical protein
MAQGSQPFWGQVAMFLALKAFHQFFSSGGTSAKSKTLAQREPSAIEQLGFSGFLFAVD